VWGLVPTFGAGASLHVPHGVGVSLLFAKADLIRAHLVNALRDHAELVSTVSTVLVTVSASLVVAMSAPSTHERPEPIRVAAPTVDHAAPHPVVAVSPRRQRPRTLPRGTRVGPATDGGRTAVSPGIMVVTTIHRAMPRGRPAWLTVGITGRPSMTTRGTARGGIATPFPRTCPPGKHERGPSETAHDRTLPGSFGIAPLRTSREGRA
jgi:hypothetical protein